MMKHSSEKNNLFLIFSLSILFLNTQVYSQSFDYYFSSFEDEIFLHAAQDSEHNYYLIGTSWDKLTMNQSKTFLVKIDEIGQFLGKVVLGENDPVKHIFDHIFVDSFDNIYILGMSPDNFGNGKNATLWKYDRQLNFVWSIQLGLKADNMEIYNARFDFKNDNIYFCGVMHDTSYRSFIGMADLNGNLLYHKIYNFNGNLVLFFDLLISKKEKIIASMFEPSSSSQYISQLIILDSLYEIDTVLGLKGKANNLIDSVEFSNRISFDKLNDSTFIVAGRVYNLMSSSSNINNDDFAVQLRKMDYSEDTTIVVHTYNIREQPGIRNLDKKWNYLYTASLSGFDKHAQLVSNKFSEFYLARLNNKGYTIWDQYYTNNSYLGFYGVLATNDGGALMYGSTYLEGYNGPNERDAYALKVDSNGNANITPAGINTFRDVASGFKMYPNPVNDELNIQMLASSIGSAEILVYNGTGTLVYRDIFEGKDIKLNTTSYTSGMYFVVVRTEDSVYKKRLIKR